MPASGYALTDLQAVGRIAAVDIIHPIAGLNTCVVVFPGVRIRSFTDSVAMCCQGVLEWIIHNLAAGSFWACKAQSLCPNQIAFYTIEASLRLARGYS